MRGRCGLPSLFYCFWRWRGQSGYEAYGECERGDDIDHCMLIDAEVAVGRLVYLLIIIFFLRKKGVSSMMYILQMDGVCRRCFELIIFFFLVGTCN